MDRFPARGFVPDRHIRNIGEGLWVALVDDRGRAVPGVRGRPGVAAPTAGGILGADLVEMQSGSSFPLHVHPGDHILCILAGAGWVHVDGDDHPVRAGDTIFVPAEYPHGVSAAADQPLLFIAVGHPHRPLESRDRMRVVRDGGAVE